MFQTTNQDMHVQYCTIMNSGHLLIITSGRAWESCRTQPMASSGCSEYGRRIECESPPSPICSMYGIFTYIWVFFGANVGKCSIHGAYGLRKIHTSKMWMSSEHAGSTKPKGNFDWNIMTNFMGFWGIPLSDKPMGPMYCID